MYLYKTGLNSTVNNKRTAIIIGAGPAGLTAAYELLSRTDIIPVVFEKTDAIGGISKTVNYKGNRIDIGGHRFFSKSERVMQWWSMIMPVEQDDSTEKTLVFMIRSRLSRIFFLRRFFDYPVTLNGNTIRNLGFFRIMKIGFSYLRARLFPVRNVRSLEDFFINRFGRELYLTFFKDYTEKVWGAPCNEISPEWGSQRIKGLSVSKALWHAVKNIFSTNKSIAQKNTETSLINQFMYPKHGPGQLWEEVARIIESKGGKIFREHEAVRVIHENHVITAVEFMDHSTGKKIICKGDHFFSTMPVRDLIDQLGSQVPDEVKKVAQGLVYRDFITVGLLLKKLNVKNNTAQPTRNGLIPDNWIYMQDRDVKVGRLQIFNNWSPYMVNDPDTAWIGLEYFCNENDEQWNKNDDEFISDAIAELVRVDFINKEDVLDHTLIRMQKTYPAYFGSYNEFGTIRNYTDHFENLFLIGRNGMHKYNNADHSMLTAMTAVDNILAGITAKDNIWNINTEEDYHESKSGDH